MTGSTKEMHIKWLGNITEENSIEYLGPWRIIMSSLPRIQNGWDGELLDIHIHRKKKKIHQAPTVDQALYQA